MQTTKNKTQQNKTKQNDESRVNDRSMDRLST